MLNAFILIYVFRFKTQDAILGEAGIPTGPLGASEHSTMRQIFSLKTVHIMAFFILIYVGTEVTIGGWIVTFLIDERGGGPSSGYISSGFFGGLTLGRLILIWVNEKIGERRVVYIYTVLAIGLELVVWLVPSLIGDAIAVSLIGLFLGPFYPICMKQASLLLPRWLLTGSVGYIAGFGQTGSAIFPFITGAIAQKHGVIVSQPILVTLMGVLLVLWFWLTTSAKVRGD